MLDAGDVFVQLLAERARLGIVLLKSEAKLDFCRRWGEGGEPLPVVRLRIPPRPP